MITVIRLIHTAIWIIMALSTFVIGYSVIRMKFDIAFFVSFGLIVAEIIIIVANAWTCPLTAIARRHTNDDAPNFDIYLPRTIAKFNKEIFSGILFIILLIYLYNRFN